MAQAAGNPLAAHLASGGAMNLSYLHEVTRRQFFNLLAEVSASKIVRGERQGGLLGFFKRWTGWGGMDGWVTGPGRRRWCWTMW
jgi:hypothetical protein